MSKNHRKYELEEKLRILRERENHRVDVTCRKHQIARSLFYSWKNKFDRYGSDELAPEYHRVDPKVKARERENESLRKIISRQLPELEIKGELLKKTKFH